MVIGGLGSVPQQEIMTSCAAVGEVEKVLWRGDAAGNPTGGAFVVFKREMDAVQALGLAEKGRLSVERMDASHRTEFEELEKAEEAEAIMQDAFKLLTPAKKQQAVRFFGAENRTPPPTTPPPPVHTLQEAPRLCTFSGAPGKDSDYSRWKYEVMCLRKEQHPDVIVRAAIRRSLKSPAADVVRRLGEDVAMDTVLQKLHALYGKVLKGDTLLQKFYGERQKEDEGVAAWACRLEDYLCEAVEQEAATVALRKKLAHRFWDGLADERVRNALRHMKLSFEDLVVEARQVEEEYAGSTSRAASVRTQQVTPTQSTNDKLDLLLERLQQLEARVSGISQPSTNSSTAYAQAPTPAYHYSRHPTQPAYSNYNQPAYSNHNQPAHSNHNQAAYSNQPASSTTATPIRTLRCHKCQVQGHLAFGCRAGTEVVCFKCRSVGHIANACLNEVAPQQ